MNFLDKMERKYGRYALSHLTMYIIVTYIAGYIIALAAPIMRQYLTLEPYYILHGQIWRLVSWILIPPSSLDIFTIIMLFFYYSIGTSLERAWGDFKYNVYIFSGILMTIIGSFLLYGILYAVNGYPSLMERHSALTTSASRFSSALRSASRICRYCCISLFRSKSNGWHTLT